MFRSGARRYLLSSHAPLCRCRSPTSTSTGWPDDDHVRWHRGPGCVLHSQGGPQAPDDGSEACLPSQIRSEPISHAFFHTTETNSILTHTSFFPIHIILKKYMLKAWNLRFPTPGRHGRWSSRRRPYHILRLNTTTTMRNESAVFIDTRCSFSLLLLMLKNGLRRDGKSRIFRLIDAYYKMLSVRFVKDNVGMFCGKPSRGFVEWTRKMSNYNRRLDVCDRMLGWIIMELMYWDCIVWLV